MRRGNGLAEGIKIKQKKRRTKPEYDRVLDNWAKRRKRMKRNKTRIFEGGFNF
jgi:hypothetical protein